MHGYVESCQQADITGWAVDDTGEPAQVTVEVDGQVVGTCRCDVPRPDVAAAGFHAMSGFKFRFPRPVGAAVREVSVKIDGKHLLNSPSEFHVQRVQRLGYGITSDQPGLELGALCSPFLSRPAFNVFYVDHAATDELEAKYLGHFDEPIVPTDIVWTPGTSLAAAAAGRTFHYAVASHVVEHVADPIGWLGEIARLLVPGGRINLAIPEKTRTFDEPRALSTPADMVDAHKQRLLKPNFRQVFDFLLGTRERSARNYRSAYSLADTAHDKYFDAHCHVWTYESFLSCWEVIASLNLVPLSLEKSWEPVTGANEFIVSFIQT